MYKLKNGILYKDGEAVFGLGSHYYSSYHPLKVPVPAWGDRTFETKKDLSAMKEAYINIVRTAAIGTIENSGGKVRGDFPVGAEIAQTLDSLDMALMVRLNGYDSGLHNYPDEKMTDENGREVPCEWFQFIRNCVNHEGVTQDNRTVTRLGAETFAAYKNLVGFQIFNEPAYPNFGFYDYNPHSVAAYRRWLTQKKGVPQAEAEKVQPPRRRPTYEEDVQDWVNWRLFQTERINDYLGDLASCAKEKVPAAETFTCMTCCPVQTGSSMRGTDFFRIAKEMDIVGITMYLYPLGVSYSELSRVLDYAESAAACFSKHAWLIEYNARTDMTAREFEVETYTAIGSGFKGIMYYQWRADYAFDNSPEPNGYGMVYNDGTHTQKFDAAMKMHRMLHRYGKKLVGKERMKQGIAILFSEHMNAYYDARCNGDTKNSWCGKEENILNSMAVYRRFKKLFVSPVAVRVEELGSLPFPVRALILSADKGLSAREQEQLDAFRKGGGKVFVYDRYMCAYKNGEGGRWYTEEDILGMAGILPAAYTAEPYVDVRCLSGEGGNAYVLVDYAEEEMPRKDVRLILQDGTQCNDFLFVSGDRQMRLGAECAEGKKTVTIPHFENGGILFSADAQGQIC